MDVFDLVAKLTLDTSDYENGLDDARDSADTFSSKLQAAGQVVSGVGTTLTNSISRPLLDIGKNILQAGMDYEAGMDEVAAISGATGAEIEALGAKAMEMAAQTKFSTAESAEAYKYMAMAGWETEDMLNALDAVMYLAGASGESLASTSDIVTDAMTAFRLAADGNSKVLKDGYEVEVSNAQRFTDVLAAASNNANTNVSMLGESFKFVASIAGQSGYTIEDTAIALGLMANTGVKASMGGTALRTILTNLLKPTDEISLAMYKLGISTKDENGEMLSLKEIMDDLRSSFAGGQIDMEAFQFHMEKYNEMLEEGVLSEEEYGLALDGLAISFLGVEDSEKAAYAATLAGKYGMAGLLAIVGASDEDYNKLTEAIYNSNGATKEMYDIMTDNAQGAVTRLDSAINVLYTSLSTHIIPIFTQVVEKITAVVNWFNDLDESTQGVILTVGAIAIAVGPVLTVIGNVITAIGTIGSALSGMISVVGNVGTAVSGLFSILAANPIALVIAGIAALVAAFILLWNNCEGFREFWLGLWEGFREAVSAFAEWFGEKIGQIAGWFSEKLNGIKEVFSGLLDGLKELASAFGEWISGKMAEIVQWVKEKWEGLSEFFAGLWEGIKAVFSGVVEFFSGLFISALEAVKMAWSTVVEFFSGIWTGIQAVFSVTAEVLGGFFSAAWEAVQGVWDTAVTFFTTIGEGIYAVFEAVTQAISDFFEAAGTFVKEVWESVRDFFQEIGEKLHEIWEEVTTFFQEKFEEAAEAVQKAWEAVKEFFQGVWEKIEELFGEAAEWFGGVFCDAWDAVTDAWSGVEKFFSGVWETIKGVWDNVTETFKGIGKDMLEGLWNGINDKVEWLKGKVLGVVEKIKSWFTGKDGFDEHSPSKWANQVFRYVLEGGAQGLDAGAPALLRDVDSIVSRVKDGMELAPASINMTAFGHSNAYSAGGIGDLSGGNFTVNIYNPEKKDAVTEAREWRKTSQRVALGFV